MPSSACKNQTCALDRKSTRLNSSHTIIPYAVFCLKKPDRCQPCTPRTPPDSPPRHPPGPTRPAAATPPPPPRRRPTALWPLSAGVLFFNDTATTEIYTLSLHDALPI